MVFSTQTSHPLTSLQEEDKLLRNVHLAEFSTNHLHKGTKAWKTAEWKADDTSMQSLYLFPASQKTHLSLACASSAHHFCCTYLMLQNSHKNSHRENLPSCHSLNQFRTEEVYESKNIQLTGNQHTHLVWILASPYDPLVTMLVIKPTPRLPMHVWGTDLQLLHPTVH